LKWKQIINALTTYKDLHGDLLVPQNYVIPSNAKWPEELWDVQLRDIVDKIRSEPSSIEVQLHRNTLQELGFVWNAYDENLWKQIINALTTYKDLHGDLLVPQNYVIPSNAKWPEELWDVQLRDIVDKIRSEPSSIEVQLHRNTLQELGFVWNVYDEDWNQIKKLSMTKCT